MTTLTADEAGKNLIEWLSRALKGEDIGIMCNGKIIALRPVEAEGEDDAAAQYGLTNAELDSAYEKISAEVKEERAAGKLKPFA